jgi:hypothetical protein
VVAASSHAPARVPPVGDCHRGRPAACQRRTRLTARLSRALNSAR